MKKLIPGLLALIVVMPIWYYLLYKILTMVQATELMWFLFWVYVPFAFLCHAFAKIMED